MVNLNSIADGERAVEYAPSPWPIRANVEVRTYVSEEQVAAAVRALGLLKEVALYRQCLAEMVRIRRERERRLGDEEI